MADGSSEVILGSGKFYMVEFNGSIPDDSAFETEANCLGKSKGGASLEYKPKKYEVKDDENVTIKSFIVEEESKLKGGILTWDLKNISKMVPGKFTDDSTKHEKILKIGGQRSFKQYAIRFVHTKDTGKKLRVTMVGSNEDGLTLKFDGQKETTIDPTFTAYKQADKVLVEIRDEYEIPATS